MPSRCSVLNCNGKNGNKTLHYFRFPVNDAERLNKWRLAMNRGKWVPTRNNRICSKHFRESFLLYRGNNGRCCLAAGAIPTLCLKNRENSKVYNASQERNKTASKDVLRSPTKDAHVPDLKSIFFSAINLKSVEPESKKKVRRSLRKILHERNNGSDKLEPKRKITMEKLIQMEAPKVEETTRKVKKLEDIPKAKKVESTSPKRLKSSISRSLLKNILPTPSKVSKKEESKKRLTKKSAQRNSSSSRAEREKHESLIKKIKSQRMEINKIQSIMMEMIKRNNTVVREVAGMMRSKNLVDSEIMVVLQKHMSNIQRLERKAKEKN